jgi:ELWxxDGT repeat protein
MTYSVLLSALFLVPGNELWNTNGHRNGTFVIQLEHGKLNLSIPSGLTVFAGKLYFAADDGEHGVELWSSTGDASGTEMVLDLNTQTGPDDREHKRTRSSNPSHLTVFNGKLYFTADDGVNGVQLWSTTGDRSGTQMVCRIGKGPEGARAGNLIVFNGKLYFTADDGVHGNELWSTTGSRAGTEMVLDLNKVPDDKQSNRTLPSNPANLTVFNNKLYFAADDGIHGVQLWSTTGPSNGTEMVCLIGKGPEGARVGNLVVFNGKLYFTAEDGINGDQLWSTTGHKSGTEMVRLIGKGPRGAVPADLIVFKGQLYFTADDGIHGIELWRTTGDKSGTEMVLDLNKTKGPNSNRTLSSYPSNLTVFNDKLYFSADDGIHGMELWSTTGSENGTELVRDLNPQTDPSDKDCKRTLASNPANLMVFNGKLYFTADDGTNGDQLWSSTGDSNGTEVVRLIDKGPRGATPGELTIFAGKLYFRARGR